MGKLIYVDDIVKRLEKVIQFGAKADDGEHPISAECVLSVLESLPTVDAVPVKHGRWIYHIDDLFPAESTQECDQCHEEQPLTCDDNFCPHCGAKMNGKDGDNHG